jgi:hypothetical protein
VITELIAWPDGNDELMAYVPHWKICGRARLNPALSNCRASRAWRRTAGSPVFVLVTEEHAGDEHDGDDDPRRATSPQQTLEADTDVP